MSGLPYSSDWLGAVWESYQMAGFDDVANSFKIASWLELEIRRDDTFSFYTVHWNLCSFPFSCRFLHLTLNIHFYTTAPNRHLYLCSLLIHALRNNSFLYCCNIFCVFYLIWVIIFTVVSSSWCRILLKDLFLSILTLVKKISISRKAN